MISKCVLSAVATITSSRVASPSTSARVETTLMFGPQTLRAIPRSVRSSRDPGGR
jgi:hypothetical protein